MNTYKVGDVVVDIEPYALDDREEAIWKNYGVVESLDGEYLLVRVRGHILNGREILFKPNFSYMNRDHYTTVTPYVPERSLP